jgi:hypothetical protein
MAHFYGADFANKPLAKKTGECGFLSTLVKALVSEHWYQSIQGA